MQVTELAAEGLKRAFTVVVPATEIAAARDQRLATLAKDIRLPGFRPGKVPMSVVKQRYGSAVMGEVLEEQVQSVTKTVIDERGLRPAMQPKIELVNFAEGADLEFKVELEQLPEIPLPDFASIALEKPVAKVGDEDVTKALTGIASRNRAMEDVTEDRPAAVGDVVMADFSGRVVEEKNLLPVPEPAGDATPAVWEAFGHGEIVTKPVAKLVGSGTEGGKPWVDVALTGGFSAGGQIGLGLAKVRAIPVSLGDKLRLTGSYALVSGAWPEDATLALDLSLRGEGGAAASSPTKLDAPVAAPASFSAEVAVDKETAATLFPVFRLQLKGDTSLGVVLRLTGLSLVKDGEGALSEPFPGGTGTDMAVEIGGTGFIPGFAEGLEGIRTGETRNVNVVFPAEYGAAELAGKAAVFEITAKGLKKPVDAALDEDFAKKLGLASLDELKQRITETLQQEYDQLSRMNVKRKLLDALSAQASFEVPEGMVEAEFAQIWQRVESDMKAGNLDADDKGKDEATLKADYRAIAERRIRLGLLLSEIGRSNNIQVANEELSRAMRTEAGRYPGQERQVMEFFQKNPQAIENLRAPLFEEKVVDFMLELAQVTEKEVPAAELSADPAA
jgi:FKBP-type peptidyl-prolyl cis-trans isomerase (trigger factor)